jgi:hypothetical protein
MNVEVGTEAVQFAEKEYIKGFSLQCGRLFLEENVDSNQL